MLPGQDPKAALKDALTKLLCKDVEKPIEWRVGDVVSRSDIVLIVQCTLLSLQYQLIL